MGACGSTSNKDVKPMTIGYPPHGLAPVVADAADWIKLGCGDADYMCAEKKATFPAKKCPSKMPDFANYGNHMAEFLRENPDVYKNLMNKKTKNGVGLAPCIKTGVDNPGHPHIKTCGLVAGDEECFEVFADIFEPVISARHGGYPRDGVQPTDMDSNNISTTKIDPTGNYVLTSRIRTGRSVRGIRLPPCISFEERRKLEGLVTKALMNLDEELKGDYFPLHGSKSYEAKPEGMSKEKEEELRSKGNLFQEPDSTLLLSSGMGRHWPDARGVFHNDAANFFVWVNEEDHMRIISMEEGDNMKRIFERFDKACSNVQKVLENAGYGIMHNDHLGFILTCPSNLGTGLRAGAMTQIPLFSAREDFKKICTAMRLQARGRHGVDSDSSGGTWDISNLDRIGKAETALVNTVIEGLAQIIKWEQALEAGEDIEAEVAAKLEECGA
jgi:creatine kinase